jgi:methylenetetrahydrofolate reductase (NADPH)
MRGDLQTNTHSDGPNAVTWGVFPGKEIVQPTIVEAVSFMAWKDEAYELGLQWARVYDYDTPSRKFITETFENSYLVNIVHNDFCDPDAIFAPFFKAGEEFRSQHPNGHPVVNGHVGH